MRRRSPWAVLAVLSLVGSLLALSAGPAAGKNGEADDQAIYSACLGSALESAGFRDVPSGSVAEDGINCMAHYGIMPGTPAGIFQPGLGVTRDQMALFLIRAAGPAGIELPDVEDYGFKDIGGLPQETQDAINQLVELRITRGTTANTFDPHSVVNRRQMAQFLTRFLAEAPVAEGGVSVEAVFPDDTVFEDIRDLLPDPYDAIRLLYELGVTKGTTTTTFGHKQDVTRSQMALFISRMLAHTNARPAGVTVQVEDTSVTAGDTVELVIAVRDEDHQPLVDAPVDLFYVPEDEDGFLSNGRCSSRAVAEWGDQRCVIDFGDETSDGDGNLYYTMSIDETLTVYAWTGDRGDRFDLDETDHFSIEFGSSKSAVNFLLTDNLPNSASRARFGRTITVTFQLIDEDGKSIAEEDTEIRVETILENDRRVVHRRTKTYSTDESGKVELPPFRLNDPDSRDDDRDGELSIDVLNSDEPVIDGDTEEPLTRIKRWYWSDNEDEATTLLLEQSSVYSIANRSGTRNRVTATLLDQYGDPVRGERVHFTSEDEDGLYSKVDENGDQTLDDAQNPYRKTTSSKGVVTVSYLRRSAESGIEVIHAQTEDVGPVYKDHYWVEEIPEGETTTGELLHHDDDDALVIDDGSDVYVVYYDQYDHFNDADGTMNYKAFKEAVEEALDAVSTPRIEVTVTTDPDNPIRFMLL